MAYLGISDLPALTQSNATGGLPMSSSLPNSDAMQLAAVACKNGFYMPPSQATGNKSMCVPYRDLPNVPEGFVNPCKAGEVLTGAMGQVGCVAPGTSDWDRLFGYTTPSLLDFDKPQQHEPVGFFSFTKDQILGFPLIYVTFGAAALLLWGLSRK